MQSTHRRSASPTRPLARLLTGTRRALLGSTTAGLVLASTATAQSMSDAAVEAEIEFARGLASNWTFVDLAQGVLDRVENAGPSERMAEELALARCELFAVGARRLSDPKEINALLEEGINAYENFLAANEFASNREEAERGLVVMALVYGRSIDNALEEAVGDEAQALKDRKIEVLEGAIRRTEDLIESTEAAADGSISDAQQLAVWDLKLKKAEMYEEIAETSEGDGGGFFTTQAIDAYEDLSFDAGPDTEIGLRANIGAGRVYLNSGDPGTALAYFEGTINLVYPLDPATRELEGFGDKPAGELQLRFNYVQLGETGAQPAARTVGELDRAIDLALFMWNLYRSQGFELSADGHDALLECAQTFMEAGGYIGGDAASGEAKWFATEAEMKEEFRRKRDQRSSVVFALDMVNQVSEATGRASTKIRAGQLLEQINTRPDIEISPDALFEAAQAKYVAQEYEAALEGYYAVLDRLPTLDPAERIGFMAKSYFGIGESLRRLDRNMEATFAYREALDKARDPEWDSRNANGMLRAVTAWGRADAAAEGSPQFAALRNAAQQFVLDSTDPDADPSIILLRQAQELRRDEQWDAALAKYGEITDDMTAYDGAQVEMGQTLYAAKRYGDALKHFETYITWGSDDANAPETGAARDNRRNGLAAATYMRAVLHQALANKAYRTVAQAENPTDAQRQKSKAAYERLLAGIEEFPSEYGDSRYVLDIQKMLADAYAKTEQPAKAKEVLTAIVESSPDAPQAGDAAMDVYFAYSSARDGLGEDADASAKDAMTREMAEALELANRISSPSYSRAYNEAKLWNELGDFEKAEAKMTAVVDRFGNGDNAEKVQNFVIPSLAEVLIAKGDRQAAKELLAPLVIGEDAPLNTTSVTLTLAKAVFGEVTGSGTRVQQIPGAGGTDDEMSFLLKRIDVFGKQAQNAQRGCDYHALKFDLIFGYWIWGQQNDGKKDSAKKLMGNYQNMVLLGDRQFTSVDDACNSEDTAPETKALYGNDVLSSRFRWLAQRVN